MKTVKCQNKFLDREHCGWVHIEMSLKDVQSWEKDWVIFWGTLTKKGKNGYGCDLRPPKIEDEYLGCFRCGGSYKNFTDANPEDVRQGSTIQPILDRTADFSIRKWGKRRNESN